MQSVASVVNVSKTGNIIANGTDTPKLRSKVFTKDKQAVGRIIEIFGPTKKPYLSIKPFKSVKAETLIKKQLYTNNT